MLTKSIMMDRVCLSLTAAADAHLWKTIFVPPRKNQVVRSEAERTGLLRKAFRFCTSSNAMIPNAGKHLFKKSLSAQSVGDFWLYSAVRTGQPHALDELTHLCQLIPQALFLLYRVRHVFFLARQKDCTAVSDEGALRMWHTPCG